MKVLDMHCDTIERMWSLLQGGKEVSLLSNTLHADIQRMKDSDYILQNFAVWVDCKKYPDPMETYRQMVGLFAKRLSECNKLAAPVKSYREMEQVERAGRISAMLTVEDGGIMGSNLDLLDALYEDGVRMVSLTWNYNNALGTAAAKMEEGDGGLTPLGKTCVERMEELSMIVDVAHLSDRGIADLLSVAKKPFAASHSNARALCPMPRNLPDELLRQMGARGCVIGLNFFVPFLLPSHPWMKKKHLPLEKCYTKDRIMGAVVRHAKYLMDVAGSESVCLGSDFDGIDQNPALPGCEAMPLLYDALRRGGVTPSQIDGIFYRNGKQFYRELL